jgi:iron complex transport system ATP-binding protein
MISMGRIPFASRWKPLSKQDSSAITRALQIADVANLADRSFFELSGGERQRVMIARALAQEPDLLLLDEPSTHLDLRHQVEIFSVLQRYKQEHNVSVICITHDLTLASQYIDRFLLLKDGKLVVSGPANKVLKRTILEDVFQTPIFVGTLPETKSPYIYPFPMNSL